MTIEKILIVEPDRLLRDFISDILSKKRLEIHAAENEEQAHSLLKNARFDLVIADLKPNFDQFIRLKNEYLFQLIFMMPQHLQNLAEEALQRGAQHCFTKPFSVEDLESVLEKAREELLLSEGKKFLSQPHSPETSPMPKIIAESPLMKQLLVDVLQIAKSHASVLISGESGTGKEVIAHTIHFNSGRSNRPFIRVNCAAMPETLIESEFFGHEKGSFTGANSRRLGRFELAHGGTLLLDEVTEIPLSLQAKLLRAVQEQEFERVGGSKPIKVDVRLISTSNRDIRDAITKKVLREDLYYRLNVVPIFLPPLRERREDIIPLAEYFLEKTCKHNQQSEKKLTPEAKKRLLEYSWPGNIRELANIIERAVVLDPSAYLCLEHLQIDQAIFNNPCAGMTLEEMEKKLIVDTLLLNQNDLQKSAESLGISLHDLQKRLERLI